MNRYKWVFKPNGGTANADSIARKLFLNDYTPLVRESIQNSLDAAIEDDNGRAETVKVIFRFGKLDLPNNSPFFEILNWVKGGMEKFPNKDNRTYKNLHNIQEALELIKQRGEINYLEVSDENTTGMDYSTDKRKQAGTGFYSFVKSLGNSYKKRRISAGSHGVGKVVFQKISKLNTLFVSTKSLDDECEYFEGLSELSTSLIGDEEYEYRGYFCLDESQEPTTCREQIPVQFRRDTYGTSVYVMGVTGDKEHQKKHLREIEKAVVENFWLSILQKKLIVQIDDEIIEGDKIIELAEKVFGQPEVYKTSNSNDTRKYIEAVYLAKTDNKHIHITDSSKSELGEVHLYVLKDKKGDNCIQYMRGSKMLIKTENHPNYGFYGVFVCEGEKGNENLRNSENAEHNKWNSSECEDKNDKINARKAITQLNDFINKSLLNIFGGNSSGKSDITGAEEFLFMNVDSNEFEDPEMEVLLGKQTGDIQKGDSPIQTTLFEDLQINENKQIRVGHVEIEKVDTASLDENGDLSGGRTDIPIEPMPAPDVPPKPIDNNNYIHDETGETGETGVFIRPIKVRYRPFFQKEDGVIYHFISITSFEDCSDATVELIVKGEEEKENIYIEYCFPGKPEENKIKGLSFTKDKSLLVKIKFEDNLPHSISLKAYENKK